MLPTEIPTHKITTYWKRGNLTRMDSERLTSLQAINWILTRLPAGSYAIEESPGGTCTITLDMEMLVPADEATRQTLGQVI